MNKKRLAEVEKELSSNASLEKKHVAESTAHLKINKVITLFLCAFVTACYGIYLLQLFQSSLNLAHEYGKYFNLIQILNSLYFFGKIGITIFAAIELFILLTYLKSGNLKLKKFIYLLILVTTSNLLIYTFISYLYNYANTVVQ